MQHLKPVNGKIMSLISLVLLLAVLAVGCGSNSEDRSYFDRCSELSNERNLTLEIEDFWGHFSIMALDSSWHPTISMNDTTSAVTIVGKRDSLLWGFNVTEVQAQSIDLNNLEKERSKLELDFDVEERGVMNFRGVKCIWSLVNHGEPDYWKTLYVTYPDAQNKRYFILGLMAENGPNIESRICENRYLLESFKIVDQD